MTVLSLKHRKRNRIRETRKDRIFNTFNLLFWILVLFIVLYPLWLILIASVSDPDAVLQAKVLLWPVDFSLMGYETVLQNSELLRSYVNSIFYTVVGSALSVIITLAAAYALSRKFAGKKLVNLAITFTMFFSGGLIPIFLNVLNLGSRPPFRKIFTKLLSSTDPTISPTSSNASCPCPARLSRCFQCITGSPGGMTISPPRSCCATVRCSPCRGFSGKSWPPSLPPVLPIPSSQPTRITWAACRQLSARRKSRSTAVLW